MGIDLRRKHGLCGSTFDTISGTTKRLEILSHLTKFYRTVIELTPENLLQCVYLTINRIAPDYEGLELGIGEGLLVKAIAESSGRSVAQVKSDLEKTGDLGDIAQVCGLLPLYCGFFAREDTVSGGVFWRREIRVLVA